MSAVIYVGFSLANAALAGVLASGALAHFVAGAVEKKGAAIQSKVNRERFLLLQQLYAVDSEAFLQDLPAKKQRLNERLAKIQAELNSYSELLTDSRQVLGEAAETADVRDGLADIYKSLDKIAVNHNGVLSLTEESLQLPGDALEEVQRKIDSLLKPAVLRLKIALGAGKAKKEAGFIIEAKDIEIHRHQYLLDEAEAQQQFVTQAARDFGEILHPYLEEELLERREEIKKLYDVVQAIAANTAFDITYKYQQIMLRQSTFFSVKHQYDQEIARNRESLTTYEKAWLEHYALCSLLGTALPEEMADVGALGAAKAAKELILANEHLTKELEKKMEMEYIAENMQKVMEELGYQVLDSQFVSMPNRNIIHGIFDFGESIINTYTSDNGSILFEVTGAAVEKRDGVQLTLLEKLKIKEDMVRFCPEFEKIKAKLAEKGIQITTQNLCPAHEKYAKIMGLGKKYKAKKAERQLIRKADYKSME